MQKSSKIKTLLLLLVLDFYCQFASTDGWLPRALASAVCESTKKNCEIISDSWSPHVAIKTCVPYFYTVLLVS